MAPQTEKTTPSDETGSFNGVKEREYSESPSYPEKPHESVVAPSPNNDGGNDSSDTETHSEDEFDWDEEDSLHPKTSHDHHRKARRGRAIWLAFMKLARPIRVILFGVLGTAILIAPLLVVELRFKNEGNVQPQVHAWSLWLSITFAASCITYLVVDAIPRIVIFVVVLFGGQVERLKTQLELTLAVSGWLKLALDIAWAWIALSAIRAFYQPAGSYWVIINRVMQALFAAGIILFVEKLFLRFVAIQFHQKALADRLAENRLGLKALDRLSNAQPMANKRNPYMKKGHKSTQSTHGTSLNINDLQAVAAGNEKEMYAPKAKDSHAERRRQRKKAMAAIIVDQVGGAIGQVALKNSRFNRGTELGSLSSARKLARKLFSALSDRQHLGVEDFYPYFKSTSEAHAAFAVFDKDGNGDISRKEMREAVQRIYRERKALTASLKDVGSVVAKLDAVLVVLALLFILFACLLIFNRSDTISSLVPLATLILGFSFIFGHSAQLLFESLVFIFSTHVFDVGDLVQIDDQFLYVKEFGLFSTTFRRVDGQEIIAPNALLSSTKLVHNMRRSNSMWESMTLTISYSTPLEVIEQLKVRVQTYINANAREWSGCGIIIDKMEFQNSVTVNVCVEHRSHWQDWGGRWGRRTEFMKFLKATCEELDLQYTLPIQPVIMSKPPLGHRQGSAPPYRT